MISEETQLVVTDDVTGATIKNGGWALVRLEDGMSFHVQHISDVVRLVLHGDTPSGEAIYDPRTANFVRNLLIESGDIGPVLGPDYADAEIEAALAAMPSDCVGIGKPRLCGSKECPHGCTFYCESD